MRDQQEIPWLPPLVGQSYGAGRSVCEEVSAAGRDGGESARGPVNLEEERQGDLEFVTCVTCGLPFILRCGPSEEVMAGDWFTRSWPGQSRQSTTTPGVWQQTTHHRNNRNHTSYSRQVQSQTTHRHRDVSSLGLRRSKTCADFAYAGRTGQSHRGSGDVSFGSLPKVHGTARESGTAFIGSSNGLADRASAFKSLANNPRLQVETVNGTTRIFRASDRRPRSLPAKFSDSPVSENTLPPDIPEPKKVLYVSKHGFHPRSKSPTYPVLIGTKDTLNLALCKKLWGIRRDLEGRKARENSVVFSEISQALVDEKETDRWYEKMFDEHEQDDVEDQDMAAIESLRLANPDGEFAQSDESISTVQPRPQVDLLFDKKYLKEHINDWTILGIDIEEEEMKTEQRSKPASSARPTSASRKPRVPIQTTTVKAEVSHRQTSFANKESKPVRTKREHRATRLPAVPTNGRVFHARDNRKKRGNKITKKPILAQQSDEELLPDLTNGGRDTRTPSPTFEFSPNEPENSDDLVLDDMDRRKSLISKYLRSPKPSESPPVSEELEDTPAENPEKADSPEQENEEEKPKELTEKEKFVLMRKRMDERKAKMQKRREDFLEYSMPGMRSQRRRGAGDPGAPSSSKNSLGSLMSTRLESMATFKTRKYQGEEVDEEDEGDEDEDEDENAEDEGDSEEDDS
ncbi:uncharacterized protein LOC119740590 isoform X2 [Patiria miniata]|uniref:Uncharacterized protein n=1 Tax=Patiria miniata TaxID=46514 RepID=A0A914B6N9_PATMI|nr:uncharacterized protein LOC119740590 isoform X2 [Patiria miniata]